MKLVAIGVYEGIHSSKTKQNTLAKRVLEAKRGTPEERKAALAKLVPALKPKLVGIEATIVTFVPSTKTPHDHAKVLAGELYPSKTIFSPKNLPCNGKSVVIVDDICRTGQSMRAVAKTALNNGATSVVCVCLAKSQYLTGKNTIAMPTMGLKKAVATKVKKAAAPKKVAAKKATVAKKAVAKKAPVAKKAVAKKATTKKAPVAKAKKAAK